MCAALLCLTFQGRPDRSLLPSMHPLPPGNLEIATRGVKAIVSGDTGNSKGGAPRPPPAADIQQVVPVSRDSAQERSESELERETGFAAPSTNQSVDFIYRLP